MISKRERTCVGLILTAFIVLAMASAGVAADNQSHSKVIYAFWPYWTDPSSYQPDWNMLTHIAYHSWEANNNGILNAPGDLNRFNIVKNFAHQNGVKMIISIKSFDKNTMDSIFAYHKDDLANNISSALQTYGADGVNLDFESPRTINNYTGVSNTELFEDLMRTIYTKVKSKNPDYYISINVAGDVEEVYRNAALSKYTDAVFLRGYNYRSSNSSTTGSPSPYNSVVNSINIVKIYYPLNKIILGLYFSGYDWPSSSSEPGSSTTGKGISVPMKKAIANAKIYERLWDSNSQTPWYKYQTGYTWHQTWYDDDQSLGLKLDYANSENIGGVGFWALGYEGNNANIWKIIKQNYIISSAASTGSTEYPKISTPVAAQKVPGFELIFSLFILAFLAIWKNKKIRY